MSTYLHTDIIDFELICLWLQELNMYRIMLQTLFNYDWVNVPLVYTQVPYFGSSFTAQLENEIMPKQICGVLCNGRY